jgi:KDO2-lipid IV(A) lauroyltransferase
MTIGIEGFIFFIIHGLARGVGSIPRKIGLRLGKAIGQLIYWQSRRYREICINNLQNAYAEKTPAEILAIAKQVFENLGKIFYEICWSSTLDHADLSRYVKIEGMQHIRDAYAKGRGVLVLTAHFGNWELMSIVGKKIGYPLSFVYRPLDFKPFERFTVRLRTRFGAGMIPKKKGLRKILRSLDRQELVGLLMDQNVALREGVIAPFLNIPACTNKGLALLALKTGAPVVPIFLLREAQGYRGIIQPEIPLVRTGDKTKDVEINTAAYNQAIETIVRQYPGQWFWVHRRWQSKPHCEWPRRPKQKTP